MDEMMIERLSAAEDCKWSRWSLGGMYAPEEDPEEEPEEADDWEGLMEDMAFSLAREA